MIRNRLECVDAGSDYCPCYLAETNDCITCSILQGMEFCDCNWRGTCIYQEYVWNGKKRKTNREIFESTILEKKQISTNAYMFKLKVQKTLARELREAGAYIFLRGANLPYQFDVPMSVVDANPQEGYIIVAFQVIGTKTKRLLLCDEKIWIRGPYWNGDLGLKGLKVTKDSKCLVITRGIAQAPAVSVIKKLARQNNHITLIIDKGSVNEIFIEKYVENIPVDLIQIDVLSDRGKLLIKDLLQQEDYRLIFSGGSDFVHNMVIKSVEETRKDPYLVVTNNHELCCGEGVCGACTTFLDDGTPIKTCKTQVDVRKAIERRVFID